jgi:hypothetical protein
VTEVTNNRTIVLNNEKFHGQQSAGGVSIAVQNLATIKKNNRKYKCIVHLSLLVPDIGGEVATLPGGSGGRADSAVA